MDRRLNLATGATALQTVSFSKRGPEPHTSIGPGVPKSLGQARVSPFDQRLAKRPFHPCGFSSRAETPAGLTRWLLQPANLIEVYPWQSPCTVQAPQNIKEASSEFMCLFNQPTAQNYRLSTEQQAALPQHPSTTSFLYHYIPCTTTTNTTMVVDVELGDIPYLYDLN